MRVQEVAAELRELCSLNESARGSVALTEELGPEAPRAPARTPYQERYRLHRSIHPAAGLDPVGEALPSTPVGA